MSHKWKMARPENPSETDWIWGEFTLRINESIDNRGAHPISWDLGQDSNEIMNYKWTENPPLEQAWADLKDHLTYELKEAKTRVIQLTDLLEEFDAD